MLRFMRKHATGYMIKVLFGLIIIVFIFWGVGSFKDREKTVAEVGGYKISAGEYRDAYTRTYNFYRTIYRDKFDENLLKELKLKEQVMNQLVDKYLILTKAREMGLSVSDQEFTDHLGRMEPFRKDGKFDNDTYVAVLKRNGVDPKHFEENERAAMVVAKVSRVMEDNGPVVDERELKQSYMKQRGQVKLGYAVFDPKDFADKVTIDEQSLAEVYEREKASFRGENVYRLKYVVVEPKSGVKDDQVYMDLLKNKDIAAYAKSKGLELFDMGAVSESEVKGKLARFKGGEWLQGMGTGDVSLPIRDEQKSYVFQLVAKEEGKPIDKAEAYKVIRSRLALSKAKNVARTKAEEVLQGKAVNPAKDTGFVPRGAASLPGVGPVPKEHQGVFSLSASEKLYGKPVEVEGRYYVFVFQDEKQPDAAAWDKEKEAFKKFYAAKVRDEFLASLREDMKKGTKVKVDWDAV